MSKKLTQEAKAIQADQDHIKRQAEKASNPQQAARDTVQARVAAEQAQRDEQIRVHETAIKQWLKKAKPRLDNTEFKIESFQKNPEGYITTICGKVKGKDDKGTMRWAKAMWDMSGRELLIHNPMLDLVEHSKA